MFTWHLLLHSHSNGGVQILHRDGSCIIFTLSFVFRMLIHIIAGWLFKHIGSCETESNAFMHIHACIFWTTLVSVSQCHQNRVMYESR